MVAAWAPGDIADARAALAAILPVTGSVPAGDVEHAAVAKSSAAKISSRMAVSSLIQNATGRGLWGVTFRVDLDVTICILRPMFKTAATLSLLILAACATPQRATIADRPAPTVGQAAGATAAARGPGLRIERPEHPRGGALVVDAYGRWM